MMEGSQAALPPKSGEKSSVLVVYNTPSRFVYVDCELLAKRYSVTARFEPSRWRVNPVKTWREVGKHDMVFCWFASWHSFFPVLAARLQGKPSVVVVGGFDTADVPQAGYGSQRGGVRKILARTIMKYATQLIVNSASARAETMQRSISGDKISLVYHGVPCPPVAPPEQRKRMVLTVGVVSRDNLLRKGLLPFVQAARFLPHVRFVHAGRWLDDSIAKLRAEAAPNVEFLSFVSDEVLAGLYRDASVYVQASLHEGFGMSLAEAMAAGCIPVVTQCAALPEVAGESGVYIAEATPRAIATGIATALEGNYARRVEAHRRILERFSLAQREEGLNRVLECLLAEGVPSLAESRPPRTVAE